MLQVKNIEKYYGSKNNVTKALDRVSFDVEREEFIAIMGASGSGKTTLLNCISTIDTISAGDILLDGERSRSFRPASWPGSAENGWALCFRILICWTRLRWKKISVWLFL